MTLIISKPGMKTKKVGNSSFDRESSLQKYITENPESIPLDELKEDITLLIVAREFPTDSGPIDAIGFDSDGEIYLIETKLIKNPDKRYVVAQVLDYGASLTYSDMDAQSFISDVESFVKEKFDVSLIQRFQDFFELNEEEASALVEDVKSNFANGGFRFVVLMNELEQRLKNLIRFVNQNSNFDLYGVEMKYYKHEDYEIVIPKLYGAEVKKEVSKPGGSGSRKKWDEASFFEDAKEKLTDSELKAIEKIHKFSQAKADRIKWGSGTATGSFNPIFERICPKSIFTVWTKGSLSFNFRWMGANTEMAQYRDKIQSLLENEFGWKEFYKIGKPREKDSVLKVPIRAWLPVADKLIEKIGKIISE